MPLIVESSFCPSRRLTNGHLQTIAPVLFRKVPWLTRDRQRLELADGDFLDLDWARHDASRKLVILTHGLESSARDGSIQGMAQAFFRAGWDVLAWNMRGCSGEANRLLRFYHSGATEDLAAVVEHASALGYDSLACVGFSLGGNLLLKYLGEASPEETRRITGAAAFSVPCDLASSVGRLDAPEGRIYTRRFIRSLRAKILAKRKLFPELDVSRLAAMRTFAEFDAAYTAPLHGFASAEDYWERCSCKNIVGKTRVRTLLVNARNDPFLTPDCFPLAAARESKHFHLETPASGGHCGFVSSGRPAFGWHERRAVEFLENASLAPQEGGLTRTA